VISTTYRSLAIRFLVMCLPLFVTVLSVGGWAQEDPVQDEPFADDFIFMTPEEGAEEVSLPPPPEDVEQEAEAKPPEIAPEPAQNTETAEDSSGDALTEEDPFMASLQQPLPVDQGPAEKAEFEPSEELLNAWAQSIGQMAGLAGGFVTFKSLLKNGKLARGTAGGLVGLFIYEYAQTLPRALDSVGRPIREKLFHNRVEYYKRLWGKYNQDPLIMGTAKESLQKAANLVNEACKAHNLCQGAIASPNWIYLSLDKFFPHMHSTGSMVEVSADYLVLQEPYSDSLAHEEIARGLIWQVFGQSYMSDMLHYIQNEMGKNVARFRRESTPAWKNLFMGGMLNWWSDRSDMSESIPTEVASRVLADWLICTTKTQPLSRQQHLSRETTIGPADGTSRMNPADPYPYCSWVKPIFADPRQDDMYKERLDTFISEITKSKKYYDYMVPEGGLGNVKGEVIDRWSLEFEKAYALYSRHFIERNGMPVELGRFLDEDAPGENGVVAKEDGSHRAEALTYEELVDRFFTYREIPRNLPTLEQVPSTIDILGQASSDLLGQVFGQEEVLDVFRVRCGQKEVDEVYFQPPPCRRLSYQLLVSPEVVDPLTQRVSSYDHQAGDGTGQIGWQQNWKLNFATLAVAEAFRQFVLGRVPIAKRLLNMREVRPQLALFFDAAFVSVVYGGAHFVQDAVVPKDKIKVQVRGDLPVRADTHDYILQELRRAEDVKLGMYHKNGEPVPQIAFTELEKNLEELIYLKFDRNANVKLAPLAERTEDLIYQYSERMLNQLRVLERLRHQAISRMMVPAHKPATSLQELDDRIEKIRVDLAFDFAEKHKISVMHVPLDPSAAIPAHTRLSAEEWDETIQMMQFKNLGTITPGNGGPSEIIKRDRDAAKDIGILDQLKIFYYQLWWAHKEARDQVHEAIYREKQQQAYDSLVEMGQWIHTTHDQKARALQRQKQIEETRRLRQQYYDEWQSSQEGRQ
jgi:hypothetical protein